MKDLFNVNLPVTIGGLLSTDPTGKALKACGGQRSGMLSWL